MCRVAILLSLLWEALWRYQKVMFGQRCTSSQWNQAGVYLLFCLFLILSTVVYSASPLSPRFSYWRPWKEDEEEEEEATAATSSQRKVRPSQPSRADRTRGADTRVPPLGGGREGEGRVIEVEAGGGNVLLVRQRRAKVVRPVEPSQEHPASPPLLRETGRIRFTGVQRTSRHCCV